MTLQIPLLPYEKPWKGWCGRRKRLQSQVGKALKRGGSNSRQGRSVGLVSFASSKVARILQPPRQAPPPASTCHQRGTVKRDLQSLHGDLRRGAMAFIVPRAHVLRSCEGDHLTQDSRQVFGLPRRRGRLKRCHYATGCRGRTKFLKLPCLDKGESHADFQLDISLRRGSISPRI